MFGADTSLVFDALQIAAIAVLASGSSAYLLMRKRKSNDAAHSPASYPKTASKSDLETRVRVLERIATDRSADLADEIESLREPAATNANSQQMEGSSR
ncbi:hypothetical protein [Qipengyuania sp. ASV99]|uniref:hypothetical protein n=1 Tax=Qipengyuania sp. ASV99 TaxID=3399681 RepID=UPI003A4C696F